MILNGGLALHPAIDKLVSGLGQRLPIIATGLGTFGRPAGSPRPAAG